MLKYGLDWFDNQNWDESGCRTLGACVVRLGDTIRAENPSLQEIEDGIIDIKRILNQSNGSVFSQDISVSMTRVCQEYLNVLEPIRKEMME